MKRDLTRVRDEKEKGVDLYERQEEVRMLFFKKKKNHPDQRKRNRIAILGQDKEQCDMLEKNVREGLMKFYMEVPITRVTDPAEIQEYGIKKEPALIYIDKIISEGKVLERNEVMNLIANS